jgi:hypothetical protein
MNLHTDQPKLRFVLLRHDTAESACARPTHWDLMIEIADAKPSAALRTWALDERLAPGKTVRATELERHRAEYLESEGPISGDRGSVERVDHGYYEKVKSSASRITLKIEGTWLRGTIHLEPLVGSEFSVHLTE